MPLKPFIMLCLLLLSIGLPQTVLSAERLDVEIRSTVLNIRQSRSTDSPVVGILHKGERLSVITTDERDWVLLEDNRGFISIHYVNILSRSPTEAEIALSTTTEPDQATQTTSTTLVDSHIPASTPLTNSQPLIIHSVSKTCRKNLQTQGYELCQLMFKLRLTERNNTSETAKITCYAEALTTDNRNIEKRYELSNTRTVNSATSDTQVILEWFPAIEPVVMQIILREGTCHLFH